VREGCVSDVFSEGDIIHKDRGVATGCTYQTPCRFLLLPVQSFARMRVGAFRRRGTTCRGFACENSIIGVWRRERRV